MHWLYLAILTALFFSFYNVFIKIASGSIHQILGAVILQTVAGLTGVIILIFLKFNNNTSFFITKKGFVYSAIAGLMVGLAEITSYYVYSKNVNASVGIPIIIGGTILFGAIISWIYLKEEINFRQIIAISFILIGVFLLTANEANFK